MEKRKILALAMSAAMALTSAGIANVAAESKYSNLILESLYFRDGDDMVVTEPSAGDKVYPMVCIQKNESAVPFEGDIIVATYDGNKMTGMTKFSAEDSAFDSETVFGFTRTVFKGPEITMPQGTKSKVFFWDSADGMLPYDEAAKANPNPETEQYYGEINFPEPFHSLMDGKFTISKEEGTRKYSTTASAYTIADWSDATEIFLSTDVNYLSNNVKDALGTDRNVPITGRNFATQYKAGRYLKANGEKQTKFIFTLLNDYYTGNKNATGANVHTIPLTNFQTNGNLNLGEGENIDALIRSGSPSGFTWVGTIYRQDDENAISQKWTQTEEYSNVYSTVKTMSGNIVSLFDFETKDAYGMPKPYVLVNSVAEVSENKGSFFQDGTTIYCNPRENDNLDDIVLQAEDSYFSGIRHNTACSKQTIMFENIGFLPRPTGHVANQFNGQDYDKAVFGFFGCKFDGGAVNAVSLGGRYTAYMVDCVAAYAFRDGFNYHCQADGGTAYMDIDGGSSTVFELNCTAYMVGDINRVYGAAKPTAGSTNNSNNASTVHDNMKTLRVGGRFWGTQGPIIGDGGFDITMGCEAFDVNTTPSDKVGIGINSSLLNTYTIDCYATGTKIRSGFLGGASSYMLDNVGNVRYTTGGSNQTYEPMMFSWDKVKNGVWNTIKTMTVTDFKDTYSIGDVIDTGGAKLHIVYDDGREEDIPLSDSSIKINNFDTSSAGEKTFNIMYKTLPTYATITVVDREVGSIALSGIKTDYKVGDSFDASTGVLKVIYADGAEEDVSLSNSLVTIEGFDTTSAGEKTITVSYKDKTATAVINVAERIMTDFTISGATEIYTVGDEFDYANGKLLVSYDNNTLSEVPLSDENVTISGFDSIEAGEKTITVTYLGMSKTYTITVNAEPVVAEHYNIAEDISGTQGEKCWSYKYALVGKSDYKDYEYFYNNGIWAHSKSSEFTYGRIRMIPGTKFLEAGNLGDSALVFTVPKTGKIKLSVDGGKISDGGTLDIIRFKIIKNGETIFPSDGTAWLTIGDTAGNYNSTYGTSYPSSYEFAPMTIEVNKGDEIIFRTNKGSDTASNTNDEHANNSGDKLNCIPVIDYVNDEEPEPEPETEYLTLKKTFKFSDDYSDVQGKNNWYYMASPMKKNEYSLMPMYEKYAYYSASGWKFASNKWTYGIINQNYTSSGFEQDPVLAFRTPIDGTVKISIASGFKDMGTGGDGVRFNIYKDSTKLFPSGNDEFYNVPYVNGEVTVTDFEPITIDVKKGEYIYFRVNMNANTSYDNLYYNPVIEYQSDIGVYLDKNYCMLDIEGGKAISEKLTYSGSADSTEWVSSDEAVAKVDASGNVTPVAPGSAYVTLKATAGETEYSTSVQVDVVNKINPTAFADGDVIAIWGDSLTHGGDYAERIEEFYAAKFPESKIDIPKFAKSGDDTIDILNRIERDCSTRSDINRAIVLLGANDFALTPAKISDTTDTYTKRIELIVNALKAKGISDIMLVTPTPFDAVRSGNYQRANLMKEFSYDLRKAASANNCSIVDAWSVLQAYDDKIKAGHEVSASMPSLMSDDNLHPSKLGYMALAYIILDAQGVPGLGAAGAQIAASAESAVLSGSENAAVSELDGNSSALSFKYTPERISYPKTEGYTGFAALETTLSEKFGEGDMLKVSGLDDAASYTLSINSEEAGSFTGKELAEGVDLSNLGAIKALSDKITEEVDLIDVYDDAIVNVLDFETKYLKTSGIISAEDGIALAEKMVSEGTLNEGSANSYKTWKNSEASWRTKLASEWNNLYNIVANRTFTISIEK